MKKINFLIKSIGTILGMCLIMFQMSSCKKFLEVQPRDYMYEEEAFSTKKGVESVLNGLYQGLSDSLLYGDILTLSGTEQMAQYYYAISGIYQNNFKDYQFTQLESIFKRVWGKCLQISFGCK